MALTAVVLAGWALSRPAGPAGGTLKFPDGMAEAQGFVVRGSEGQAVAVPGTDGHGPVLERTSAGGGRRVAADATLIVTPGAMGRGTALTVRHAKQVGKPVLVVDLGAGPDPG